MKGRNMKKSGITMQHCETGFSLHKSKAVCTGLEPVTPCVTGMYSNQLN